MQILAEEVPADVFWSKVLQVNLVIHMVENI